MPISGYFDKIFGVSGDLTSVPDATQVDGTVSYEQGWPAGYQLPYPSDPSSIPISRTQTNQLFHDVTAAIQQLQQHGTPNFITSAMNNGSPFSYSIGDRVINGGVCYTSLVNTNTTIPPSTSWAIDKYTASGGNGYIQLPNGIIVQWMHLSAISDPYTATLPLTFPTANIMTFASYGGVTGSGTGTTPPAGITLSAESETTSTSLVRFSSVGGGGYGVNILVIGR